MTEQFPPHDLECPEPTECTMAVDALTQLAQSGDLATATFSTERAWYRVYDAREGFGSANPGFGNTRFAPFDDLRAGRRIPTMYLADTLAAALLETSFHDVHLLQPRVVSELALHGSLHAQLLPPQPLTVVDLRDDQLDALGLSRENLASSSYEHYPCTRRVAQAIHASENQSEGIVWNSRQAELSGKTGHEVMVLFADRVAPGRDAWSLGKNRSANGSLLEGAGRELLDEIAESLTATIIKDL